MKATIERATLLKCLSHVQSVVERRNTIPILSNVLIEASGAGAVKLMATDLDIQVVESMVAVSVDANDPPQEALVHWLPAEDMQKRFSASLKARLAAGRVQPDRQAERRQSSLESSATRVHALDPNTNAPVRCMDRGVRVSLCR